jgi:hypothetical protein
MALLVKEDDFDEKTMSKLLAKKGWKGIEVFPLL